MTLDIRRRYHAVSFEQVSEAGHPTFHRRLWFEPVEAPADLICEGCHRQAPFVIWMHDLGAWRCTTCADQAPEPAA